MTYEYQDISKSSDNTSPADNGSTNTQPTSAPHNVTNNNFDITNPFTEPKIKNSEQDGGKSASQANTSSEPQVTFADIVKQKQFGSLAKDIFDKVNEGDVDSFNSGLQTMMQQVYKTAIEDSNRLMTARMQEFESQLMNKLNTSKEADSLLTDLKSAIPYAKDAAVEPVARQVLSGYLRQGMSKNEAIAATNSYFSRLAQSIGQSNQPKAKAGTLEGKSALDELFN